MQATGNLARFNRERIILMLPTQPDESSSQEQLYVSNGEETPTLPALNEETRAGEGQTTTTEETLPPEAQGETNGGPLGCCLGTVVGILLTALLLLGTSLLLSNGGLLGFATLPVIILGAIICGYFGWKIGKRVYKEYEPPVVKRQYRTTSTKKRKRKVAKAQQ